MGVEAKLAYRDFLKSDEWETIRFACLAAHGIACHICGHEDFHNDVHHVMYPKRWRDTKPHHTRVLCRSCHEQVHEHKFERIDERFAEIKRLRLRFRRGARKKATRKAEPVNPMEWRQCHVCHYDYTADLKDVILANKKHAHAHLPCCPSCWNTLCSAFDGRVFDRDLERWNLFRIISKAKRLEHDQLLVFALPDGVFIHQIAC